MKVYYRLSNLEAGMSKKKIPNATKQHCLENCIAEFGADNIIILGDRLNDETRDYVNSLNIRLVVVYLLEDDFLHLPNSKQYLEEALSVYNAYVTLYDHPDKYLDRELGGNPFITQSSEVTRLLKTNSIHWKITNSTVMSFAAKVSRLKDDYDLIMKYSSERITDSFRFFTELNQTKKIPVLSSVPGKSTHCESAWLSPLTNWTEV